MKNQCAAGLSAHKNGHMTGMVSRALCQAYGTTKPLDVVAQLAFTLRYSARVPGPPFSPMEYARSLNIPVKYARIEADGVFTDTETAQSVFRGSQSDIDFSQMSKGPTIILKEKPLRAKRSLKRRENFTLAHELGHYIIRSAISEVTPLDSLPSDDPEEERLCNAFAEELLMPATNVYNDVSSGGIGSERLLWLTDRYDVSVQAIACRVARLYQDKVACIIWENVKGWHTVEWASPPRLRRALLCNTGKTTVETAAQTNRPASGRDDLLLDGERMRWVCESSPLSKAGNKILTVMWRSEAHLTHVRQRQVSELGLAPISPPVSPVPVQQLLPFYD